MRLQLQAQSVSNLVARMEEARAAGTVASILEQTVDDGYSGQVVAFYRGFVGQSFFDSAFHTEHVEAVTQEALWPLRPAQIVFPGAVRQRQRASRDTGELLEEWAITHLESLGLVLRPDQVLSARYWEIGFDLRTDEDEHLLDKLLLGSCTTRLVRMLRDLESVEQWFRRMNYVTRDILPPRDAADFEQLLIDVLNEHDYRARHAPLQEDLLEKTDLRVHLPTVRRRRGARVQVTTTIDPLFYQNKLAAIDRLEEIVVLSPASIAQFVNETGREWQNSLLPGSKTALLKDQAVEIRDSLLAALKHPHNSPLGPLINVPEDLRKLIRDYIEVEATRSTNALRDREVKERNVRLTPKPES
jgi:hypothetical protein